LEKLGDDLSEADIDDMIADVDTDGSGWVDFEGKQALHHHHHYHHYHCLHRHRRRRPPSLTRKLSYRKDDRMVRPIYWCPANFRESLSTPTATFAEIINRLLFRSII